MTYGIHDAILERLQAFLQDALIDNITGPDDAKAGVVKIGPLQGDPEPDDARISVEIYGNDPLSDETADEGEDQIVEVECGGACTWSRKFTLRVRLLFDRTRETLDECREITSTVKERIEIALLKENFVGIASGNEYVSRGPLAGNMRIKTHQGGGPPDSFDFRITITFDVLTTRTGVFS